MPDHLRVNKDSFKVNGYTGRLDRLASQSMNRYRKRGSLEGIASSLLNHKANQKRPASPD